MQLSFLICLCITSTDLSHACGYERLIGLGLCWQQTNHTAEPYGATQSRSCDTGLGSYEVVKSDFVGHDLVLTHVPDAYVLERYLGLGFWGNPSTITLLVNALDKCKSKGSVFLLQGKELIILSL